jgi:PilZ domain
MAAGREIRAKEIVTDILSGIGDNELMHKYKLTFRGLQSVYRQLVESSIVDPAFLKGRFIPPSNTERSLVTRLPRKEIYVPLPVQDAANPDVQGMIVNISERGLGVKGLKTAVDEIKKLIIRPDKFLQLKPFALQAKCRWVTPADDSHEILAGFEIILIADKEQHELRALIETLEYMYR